jgi:hypothetical protein
MAQHISIKNSPNKIMQSLFANICKQFERGLSNIRSSLKFQEVYEENFKESENDNVFITWRTVDKKKKHLSCILILKKIKSQIVIW